MNVSPTTNTTNRSPAPFRYPAISLLLTDTILLFRNFAYLPYIIFPLCTTNPRGELYPWSLGNIFTLLVHVVFIVVGVLGFGLIPLWLQWPGVVWLLFLAGYGAVVWALAWVLNKVPKGELIESEPPIDEVPGEKWVFVNGVMAGRWWVQGGIDELQRRFGRPIEAIHNRTYGLVLDILQCLIQRDVGLTSGCVRNTYKQLRTYLLMRDPKDRDEWKYKKIVVVAHSQGGLITSLALDMLYADLADEVLQRLEIYTFGCAANHFNNPPNTYAPTSGGAIRHPTIKHIEHYANESDFVSRFGVLAYHPGPGARQGNLESGFLEWPLDGRPYVEDDAYYGTGMEDNQFAGKLFVRLGKGGHQFVMHYLDEMFNVGEDGKPVFVPINATTGAADEKSGARGARGARDAKGAKGARGARDVLVDAGQEGKVKKTDFLEETSRLWSYRGGRVLND